ncbi:hypothetical protein GCM10009114_09230 [Aliiglaciecola litoralis]|uniref:DUF3530 domain-containing protein n=1 Tax=Aliiglaciecola litoralis TaxID=582857 RepID=A0ABP3WNU0_9ALTE
MIKLSTLLLSVAVNLTALAQQSIDVDAQDIEYGQFADQYDMLLAGEQSIAIVIQESNTAITRGVAVLLSEAGRNPFSQHGLKLLTKTLNDVGWVTMVMPAPLVGFWPEASLEQEAQADQAEQQQTTAQQEQTSLTESEQTDSSEAAIPKLPNQGNSHIDSEAFAKHEQQLILQMRAIEPKAAQYPGFFLVIAQGSSAAWLTKIYAQNKLGNPDGLVVVSPYWPDRHYNQQFPQWLAATQMPVLDVYSPWDPAWSTQTVEARRIAAHKALKMIYRQRELTGQKPDQQQYLWLAKEIYGWLTHMGW